MPLKQKAMLEALREEIDNRDGVHSQLEIIDLIVHELLEMTKPKHTIDEDCGCAKVREG